jgi:hypothetical protein
MATDLSNWERGINDCIKVVRWRQKHVKPDLMPLYEELVNCMEAVKARGCYETYAQLDACTQCGRLKCHHGIVEQEDCRFLSEVDSIIKGGGMHWDPPDRPRPNMGFVYFYETNCTEAAGEDIQEMREAAVPISYLTMQKHCYGLKRWALDHGYRRLRTKGPTLRTDPFVGFYKSTYQGKPCYYLTWSGIEWIWTKELTA